MTLQEVKDKVGVQRLELNTATTLEGEKTDWLRHWDNDRRVAVSVHKETLAEIKVDMECTSLAVQTEMKEGPDGEYTAYRIVRYAPAEETL